LPEVFSKTTHEAYVREPQGPVGRGAPRIIRLRVRREFPAALRDRPLFGGRDESPPHAAAARLRSDEPPLQVGDAVRHAALGPRADRHFRETDGAAGVIRDEDRERLRRRPLEETVHLASVFGLGLLGPEPGAERCQGAHVLPARGTNRNHVGSGRAAKSGMECALEGGRREANMSTTTLIIVILVILLLFGGFGYRRWRR
jgi:hypothetical protein